MVYSNNVLLKAIQYVGVNVSGHDLGGRDGEDGEYKEEKRVDEGVHADNVCVDPLHSVEDQGKKEHVFSVRVALAHPRVSDMIASV